jgi:hypothetical protein
MASKPGRVLINWRTPERQIAVGLAYHHFAINQVRNEQALFERVAADYDKIAPALLGRPYTWAQLEQDTLAQHKTEITPHKLKDRADKAARKGEHQEARRMVIEAITQAVRATQPRTEAEHWA